MSSKFNIVSISGKVKKVAKVFKIEDDIHYLSQSTFIEVSQLKLINLNNKIIEQIKEMTKYSNSITKEMEEMETHRQDLINRCNNIKEIFENELDDYIKYIDNPLYSKFIDIRELNEKKDKIKNEIKNKIDENFSSLFDYQLKTIGPNMILKMIKDIKVKREINNIKINTFKNLSDIIHSIIIELGADKNNIKLLEEKIKLFYDYIKEDTVKEYFLDTYLEFEAQRIRSFKVEELKYYKIYIRRMKHLKKISDLHKILDYLKIIEKIPIEIEKVRKNYNFYMKQIIDSIRKFRTGYYDNKSKTFKLKPFYDKLEETENKKWNKIIKEADFYEITKNLEEFKKKDDQFNIEKNREIEFIKKNKRINNYYNLLIDTHDINIYALNMTKKQVYTRKINSDFRKRVILKISKLKEKKDLVNIFNIIETELGSKKITLNKNGIFFDMNTLSDNCVIELANYLTIIEAEKEAESETECKIKYKPYSVDELENVNKLGPKLNNQEKSILKKINKL